jgi:CDP-ribitol ribitolphosphotransferase
VRRVVVTVRIVASRAGFLAGSLHSPRPRVVLATSHAETISGNLAYLAEELAARTPPVPVVVVASRPRRGIAGRVRAVLDAARAGYHLASARVFVVDDYFFPMYVVRPRPGTFRVQVWHAAGAFKKFGYSVLDKAFGADEAYVRRVAIHSNYSVALVSSMSVAPHYAEAFRQPMTIFASRYGVPRTDLFTDPARRERALARIRDRYGLPDGRRVVLYAPTFRGDAVHVARYDDLLDLRVMHEVLGDDHAVLLRLHPFVRRALDVPPDLTAFAIDASDDPDVNELMLVADILVTDYSSAIYEFALLGRPIAFLAPDDDAYRRERGFYLDFPAGLPGPVFVTTRELALAIRAGAFDLARVRAFAAASFDVVDGHATERLVDEVVLPALRGESPATGPPMASAAAPAGEGSDR